MRHTAWIVVIAAFVAGCQTSVPQERQAANQKWHEARAAVVAGVGEQYLTTGQLDKAHRQAVEALSLDPSLASARMLLGKVLLEKGQYVHAATEFEKVLRAFPRKAEVNYMLAIAYERSGRLTEALRLYKAAYELDESSLAPIVAAGEVLVQLGRLDEASQLLESHTNLAGTDPAIFELAGRIAMMQGRYTQAAEHYDSAIGLDPKNQLYKLALGRAQFSAGQFKAAIETLQKLAKTKAHRNSAAIYTMIGESYLAIGRPYEARSAYYRATELEPSSAQVWADMAKGYLAVDDVKRAILAGRQALQRDRANLDAAMLLGYAFLRDNQTDRAVAFLHTARATHPSNATLACLLGQAYARQGKRVEAARLYAAALQLDPNHRLARLLLEGREGKAVSVRAEDARRGG